MNIFLSLFLISFSILSYEILLMRIFSITSWSHFAYMVISVALLGFGASGTFIAVFRMRLRRRFHSFFTLFSFLFAISLYLSLFLSQKIPFDPFLIVWFKEQYLYLLGYYLILFIPFFLGACCIGISFVRFDGGIHKVYFYNLLGSGAGALGAILLMYVLFPTHLLLAVTLVAFVASIISSLSLAKRVLQLVVFSSFIIMCVFFLYPLRLDISQYKSLSTSLHVPGARILSQSSSPLGLIQVVESDVIRHAPGLSLNFQGEIPPQLALFIDADSMSAITNFAGDPKNLRYLDYTSQALAYHLLEKPEVLILGSGGGSEVLTALYHEVRSVDAVEINPQVVDLVREEYGEFSNHIYSRPDVHVKVAEGRGFIQASSKKYHLIQIALLDSFAASSAGVYALSESYIYTVEAVKEYLRHLRPGGILSITRWLKMPPRDGIKLFATAIEALEEAGIDDPSSHLIFIRSWATSTLLIKNSSFTASEIQKVREFSEERLFDIIWYEGIESGEVNRYNILEEPYYYEASSRILSPDRDSFYRDYLFHARAATDNSPYFFHFFRLKSLPHLLRTMGAQWVPFMEWGYIVLVATLVQAVVVSIFLIILPLFFLKEKRAKRSKSRVFVYFVSLGLAYMFMEISFIQRFTLFLSYPIYAAAVVIAGFLFFSGWGSYLSGRFSLASSFKISMAVGAIIVVSLVYLFFIDDIFSFFISSPDSVKILVSLLLISPLALFMGMPFPVGLTTVSSESPPLVPWAWGINGCASVISPVLATILAISFGFNLVVLCALLLYLVAVVSSLSWKNMSFRI
ncbi:SAM-dependent methyltransferase [Candidatus Aerophobetes bacterium]|uniref:SAM-dependent methyltransferase n=1 Tax=Aerophobetes bacterium TaxID=2030807 RepID=A0A523WAB0_UNCAE|nr:MAG: SAM-dependent methyltransferase [Candidatus Aerophobetes bacterium]